MRTQTALTGEKIQFDNVSVKEQIAGHGGITNANGDPLCEIVDAEFVEVSGLFRAAINEGSFLLWGLLVGEGTEVVTHTDPILTQDFEGVWRTWSPNISVWNNSRQVINQAVNSEVPATQTFNVLNGEEYVFSAYDIFNYTFTGVGVNETLIGDTLDQRKAITLTPTSDGVLTMTVVSEG